MSLSLFRISEEVSGVEGFLGLRGRCVGRGLGRQGSHEAPALCPHDEGFGGLPSRRAAMFDSLPTTFVGGGFVSAAWNGGAWGMEKVQFCPRFIYFFFKSQPRKK